MTLRLHDTLSWIEEDFHAGRITFAEALEAYVLEMESTYEAALDDAYQRGYDDASYEFQD